MNITPPSLPLYENQIDTNYGPHLYKMSNRYAKTTPFHGKAYSLVKATMNKAQKKTFVSWGDIAMDEDEEKLIEMHDPLKGDNRCWGDIQMEEDEKNKQEGWTVVKKKSKQ